MKSVLRGTCLLALVASTVACSGGGSSSSSVTRENASSGLAPEQNGFAFANFGSRATAEVFNADDLVQMFGAQACVDENTTSCVPTAEAASWARMVNEARASGHCEGLAVQSASRFSAKADPVTVSLQNQGDVTHGIIRAFATQFLPEVQDATNSWAKKSLADIVEELRLAFAAGATNYTLGVYTDKGGHAVLPYAIQFPDENLAVIKVYDSNWPGAERYVVVDLKAKQWFFSFNGKDPKADECAWTGGEGDMDLTPMDVRTSATCPFCGDKSQVAKTVLLIRSVDTEWSVKTKNGTFSPASAEDVDGVSGNAIRTATCEEVVRIPEFVLLADEPDIELNLPNTSSAYISNGTSMVEVKTDGKKDRAPIKITRERIEVKDPSTKLVVANNNLATTVVADESVVTIGDEQIVVEVATGGITQQVVVDQSKPQVQVTVDNGAVQETTNNLGLNNVENVIPPALTPPEVKGVLPPTAERDLSNTNYVSQLAAEAATRVRNATLESSTTTVEATTTSSTTTSTSTTTTLPVGAPKVIPSESTVTALPKPPTPLTNTSTLTPGQSTSVTVSGFAPFEWVQMIVASTPQVLDTEKADSNGRVTLSGVLPANLSAGSHTLAVYAPASKRGFKQSISVSPPTTIAQTTTTGQATTTSTISAPKSTSGTTTSTTLQLSSGNTTQPTVVNTTQTTATPTTAAPTTVAPPTTQIPTATFKVVISSGSNSALRIDMGTANEQYNQNWSGWSCTGTSGCDNATATVPENHMIFVRIRNAGGGYVCFGTACGTFIQNNDFYITSFDERRCGPSWWPGFANDTCTFYVQL